MSNELSLAPYMNYMSTLDTMNDYYTNLGSTSTTGAMSMNGSLFGGIGGIGVGFGGSQALWNQYNSDPKSYYTNMYDIQTTQAVYQYDLQKTQIENNGKLTTLRKREEAQQNTNDKKIAEASANEVAGPEKAIQRQARVLQRKIKDNEQVGIGVEYQRLEKLVKEKMIDDKSKLTGVRSEDIDESVVKATTEEAYLSTTGEALVDGLEKHSPSEFVQGMLWGTGLGYVFDGKFGIDPKDKKNYKDNLSDITGEQVSTSDYVQKGLGIVAGAGLTILGIVAAIKHGGKIPTALKNIAENNAAKKALSKAENLGKKLGDIKSNDTEIMGTIQDLQKRATATAENIRTARIKAELEKIEKTLKGYDYAIPESE